MNDLMLAAVDLRKSFYNGKNRIDAVHGIDISLRSGESLFITGPSGAGKSTLLHILAGFEKPDNGEVILGGENIYRLSDKRRAFMRNEKIGFIFQFYHLLPEFTAAENVMLPGLMRPKCGKRAVKKNAEALLAKMGLSKRFGHKPQELSGGEQQRVAIARSLINSPRILFCDEPTGNLDSKNSRAIYELLFGISKEDGLTLAVVTHETGFVSCADRCLVIKDGLLV